MKNPSIASINDPVSENLVDGGLEVYFFMLGSKAWEEQHGNGVVIPPLPIKKSACVHIHTRERVHSYPSLVLMNLKQLSKAYF